MEVSLCAIFNSDEHLSIFISFTNQIIQSMQLLITLLLQNFSASSAFTFNTKGLFLIILTGCFHCTIFTLRYTNVVYGKNVNTSFNGLFFIRFVKSKYNFFLNCRNTKQHPILCFLNNLNTLICLLYFHSP